MDSSVTQNQSGPQNEPQLLSLFLDGASFGMALTIPDGFAGVLVMGDRAYDAVGSGVYTVDGHSFPLLAKQLRLDPGQMPNKPVSLSVYLVNLSDVTLSWSAYPIVTKNSVDGFTYCTLSGRCTVRIVNPPAFYAGLKAGWAATLKRLPSSTRSQMSTASPGQQAETFVVGLIKASASMTLDHMNLKPDQVPASGEALWHTIGAGAAAALQSVGVQCTGFEIGTAPVARRAPCGMCASTSVPTAYGIYRRTISLIYFRFGAKREGNFCVPCAAKISAAYNATMLVCGWWGMIGLVLTPIYIINNCFQFSKTAFGQKEASLPASVEREAARSDVWPPPPADEWGQEVQEK